MPSPTNVPASLPERLADAEGERYTVIYEGDPTGVRILNGEPAPGRAVGVLLGDLAEKYDAEDKRLDADFRALEARLTAAESAREEAASERDAFRDKLAEMFGQLMLAEVSAAKLRTEREHTDLRIRAQRARLRELEPCVGSAVATDGRVRLLQFARKKAAECRSLRRASDAALARAEKAEKALEASAYLTSRYRDCWLGKTVRDLPEAEAAYVSANAAVIAAALAPSAPSQTDGDA